MDLVQKTFDLSAHGFPYQISVQASESLLSISVEDLDSCQYWKGEYSSEFIESATMKTGNSKKYPTFLKMLVTAMERPSETVDCEILSYAEIQRLKSRASGGARAAPATKESRMRYLIINYAGEFADKVHYPLQLSFQEHPSEADFKRTIARLRAELEGGPKEGVARVRQTAEFHSGEAEALSKEKKELERTHEEYVREAQREAKRLQTANDDLKTANQTLQAELAHLKTEMDTIIAQLEDEDDAQTAVRSLKEQVQTLELKQEKTNKQITMLQQENTALLDQLQAAKAVEKKQRLRISQLESELETAMQSRQRKRTESPAQRGVASRSPRVTTPRDRPDSRSSARSSDSEARAPVRRPSPSSSISRKKSPQRNPSGRQSPQRRLESPKRSAGVRRNSPSARKPLAQTTSRSRLADRGKTDSDRENLSENSPRSQNVTELNARLARLHELMKAVKR